MSKFFRRGISKTYFLPSIADLAAPTRAEITAGEDLSPFVTDMNGFTLSNSPIPTPALSDRYTSQIAGEDTTEDSTLTLNDHDSVESTAVRAAIAKDTEGFILLMPYGDVPTKRCESWPVTVTGLNDEWTLDNTQARYIAGFAVTGVPEQTAVIPASV